MFRAVIRSNVSAVRAVSRRNASTATPALANIETKWRTLSATEQNAITKQLEQVQKQQWTEISLEDKKAGMSACRLLKDTIPENSCLLDITCRQFLFTLFNNCG